MMMMKKGKDLIIVKKKEVIGLKLLQSSHHILQLSIEYIVLFIDNVVAVKISSQY